MKYETVQLLINEQTLENNDVFAMIEPLWWTVSIYDGEQQYYRDLSKFSEPQKYVFAIQWYLSEVNNGGHDQFYYNSTGIVWEEAMTGFQVIGLDECYSIISDSVRLMGGNPSKDREKRQEQLEECNPDFEEVDNGFYTTEEDIEGRLLRYIKANINDFTFNGKVNIPK